MLERIPPFILVFVVVALVAFGDRALGCAEDQREHKCRDEAVATHRECADEPDVCERKARAALDLCLGE